MMLQPGEVVAGRFAIEGVLGEGGMGTVYLARHLALPRKVAIKVLKQSLATDPSYVERFRREAIAASQVVHPNVGYITDFGKLDGGMGSFYIVMEYLNGVGIDHIIDTTGAMSLSRSLNILIQLADALAQCHEVGVIHRDLKVENILLCEIRGNQDVVKLVDFGIANIMQTQYSSRITMKGQVFGTPEYMSPEQAMDGAIDERTDIYAFGIVAFEMVTGAPPFTGGAREILQAHLHTPPPPPSSLMDDQLVPTGFDGVVLKCLQKEPDKRFQKASNLRQELIKVRGQLAGMAEFLLEQDAQPRQRTESAPRVATKGAWTSIGAQRELAFTPFEPNAPESGPLRRIDHGRTVFAASSRETRKQFHKTLKELAFLLRESEHEDGNVSEKLAELLKVDEESNALRGKVALLEQSFGKIRFEMGEQENMLRYASLDLKQIRAQLQGSSAGTPSAATKSRIDDLNFQIQSLEGRVAELRKDRQARIEKLNEQVRSYRDALDDRDELTARLYAELHRIVDGLRTEELEEPIAKLFNQIDKLDAQLDTIRATARDFGEG